MYTLLLNVENETALAKLKAFISSLKDGICIKADIEELSVDDNDFKLIEEAKSQNAKSYSIEEAKAILGWS